MVFYKGINNPLVFQLLSLESREDFSLWDTISQRFVRDVDPDVKYMNATKFALAYPNMRKASQYIRKIAVYENNIAVEYDLGFKKTAHEQIEQFVSNMRVIGQNPLAVRLKMTRTGSGLTTSYGVTALDTVGIPSPVNPVTASNPVGAQVITPKIQKPAVQAVSLAMESTQELVLTVEEKQILDLFNNETELYSEEKFLKIFNSTLAKYFNKLLMPDRVKQIFTLYKR